MPARSLNKASRLLLLDLINDANATSFTTADLNFSNPLPLAEGASRNTQVNVSGTGTTTFTGTKPVTYDRLDLAVLFGGLNLSILDTGEYATTLDLLPIINGRYGLAMDATDIEDAPLDLDGAYPKAQTLVAKPTSYLYTGQVAVRLTTVSEPEPSDATITYNTVLPAQFINQNGDPPTPWNYEPNQNYALYESGDFLLAVRPVINDYDTGVEIAMPSTGAGLYAGSIDGDDRWRMSGGIAHPQLTELVDAGRVGIFVKIGGDEFIGKLVRTGGSFGVPSDDDDEVYFDVPFDESPTVAMFIYSALDRRFENNFSGAQVNNNGSFLDPCEFGWVIYAEDGTTVEHRFGVTMDASSTPAMQYTYNATLPSVFENPSNDSGYYTSWDGTAYVVGEVDSLLMAMRPVREYEVDGDWAYVTPADVNGFGQYIFDGFGAGDYSYVSTVMRHPNLQSLVQANRVQLRIYDDQGAEAVFPVSIAEFNYDNDRQHYCISFGEDNTAWSETAIDDDSTIFMIDPSLDTHTLGAYFSDAQSTVNTGALLGSWSFTLELLDEAASDVEYSVNMSATFNQGVVMPPGEVGDAGFVVSTASRTFLADQLSQAVLVEDDYAPTDFPILLNGDNGEVYAFRLDGSWNEPMLTMRWSTDRGQSWQEHVFPDYYGSAEVVFFRGQVYMYMQKLPEGLSQRVCRLTQSEGWVWEYVFDPPYGVDSMACNDSHLTVVDSNRFFHHTDDGVTWTQESFETATYNGETVYLSNTSVRYIGDTLVGLTRMDGNTYWGQPIAFVRNGPGDFTFKDPSWYNGISNITYTPAYWMNGAHTNMSVVDNRWFVVFNTDVESTGMKRTRGDIFYTDNFGDSWTLAASDTGITQGIFTYDGERLLFSGQRWNGGDGAGWAGLSLDQGATWTFDSDESSPFGAHRDETYYAAARKDLGVLYPDRVSVPPLPYEEVNDLPNGLAGSGGSISLLKALSDDSFIVSPSYQSQLNTTDSKYLMIYDQYGNQTSFEVQLTSGTHLNTGVVNDVAELSGGRLLIVGNFTAVNGVPRNGMAVIDRTTGALDASFPNHDFRNFDAAVALLMQVQVADSGKIYIGGSFETVNGEFNRGVVRFNTDGSLDSTFYSPLEINPHQWFLVRYMCAFPGNRVIVAGDYVQDRALMLLDDGAIDPDFKLTSGEVVHFIKEGTTGVTILGHYLEWDGGDQVSVLQVFLTEDGDIVRDTSFVQRVPAGGRGVKLSNGVYAILSNAVQEHNGFYRDNLAFFDGQGTELDYTDLRGFSAGSQGEGIAVNSQDRIMLCGQFGEIKRAQYPRYWSVIRDGLAMINPRGLQDGIGGGSQGPDEASVGDGNDPYNGEDWDRPVSGDSGEDLFFVSQAGHSGFTGTFEGYRMSTDANAPTLSTIDKAAVASDQNGTVVAMEQRPGDASVDFKYSFDSAQTWSEPANLRPYELIGETGVLVNGDLYTFLYSYQDAHGLYRITRDGVSGEVTATRLADGEFRCIATNGTAIAAIHNDGRLFWSDDGTVWENGYLQHSLDGSPANVELKTLCFDNSTLVAVGYPGWNASNVQALALSGTSLSGEWTTQVLNLSNLSNWGIGYDYALQIVNGVWLLALDGFYDYVNYTDNSFGDILRSEDQGQSWNRVIANTGITKPRFAVSGSVIAVAGPKATQYDGPSWLAWSSDVGQTWTYDQNPDSIPGTISSERTFIVGLTPVGGLA